MGTGTNKSGNPTYQARAPNRDKFDPIMLSFEDHGEQKLLGGYRTAFDPRPALQNLESNVHVKDAWHELWEGLHHQGNVGEASYAAVPHLVQIHCERGEDDWNIHSRSALTHIHKRGCPVGCAV